MFWIVLNNVPRFNCLDDIIKSDLFFNHLMVGVLGDAEVFCPSLMTYLPEYSPVSEIIFHERPMQFTLAPSLRQGLAAPAPGPT